MGTVKGHPANQALAKNGCQKCVVSGKHGAVIVPLLQKSSHGHGMNWFFA